MSSDGETSHEVNGDDGEQSGDKEGVQFTVPVPTGTGEKGTVGIREGVTYGIGLIVYIVGIVLIVGILGVLASVFVAGSSGVDNSVASAILGLFGLLISLTVFVVLFAGFAGIQYKIIADAVSRGTAEA